MAIQLAVSTYSLGRWRSEQNKTLEDSVAWIAAQGIKGVEFAGLDQQAEKAPLERAKALRKCCDSHGLIVPSYCVGAEFLVPPDKQAQMIKQIKQAVDVAEILGASTMRHDITRGPDAKTPMTLEQVLEAVVPPVREIADYAAKKGIKTSVENHGFYLQTADRIEQLVKAVGKANFGVTLDMGNFLCLNQDPVQAVQQLAKYSVMVHIKDFFTRPKDRVPPTGWFATPTPIALRGAIVGHGVIDIPAQLAALKQAHYGGWLSLEFEGMEEPATAVKLGLDYVRNELKKLEI